jgi:hypothetical protein
VPGPYDLSRSCSASRIQEPRSASQALSGDRHSRPGPGTGTSAPAWATSRDYLRSSSSVQIRLGSDGQCQVMHAGARRGQAWRRTHPIPCGKETR